jgi:hypothetical protein
LIPAMMKEPGQKTEERILSFYLNKTGWSRQKSSHLSACYAQAGRRKPASSVFVTI